MAGFPAGFGVGVLCGLVSGLRIRFLKLNAFITTLVMQQIARGAVYVLTKAVPSASRADTAVPAYRFLGSGSLGEFPMIVLICTVLVIVGDLLVRKSGMARNVFFVGSNEKAAILSGIDARVVKLAVYTLTGALSGLAGVLMVSRFGTANLQHRFRRVK
jgi:ribose transport system permease protein